MRTVAAEDGTTCVTGLLASSLPGGIVGLLLDDFLNSEATWHVSKFRMCYRGGKTGM